MDKRNERSIRLIRDSILELLDEKPYAKITVADIAERANIARQTFYNYYQTKDELMLSFMDDVFEDFFDAIEGKLDSVEESYDMVNRELYSHWYKNSDILLKVINANIDNLVFERFRRYITRILGNMLRRNDLRVTNPDIIGYTVDYIAGASFHVILRWMKEGTPYDPEFMGRFQSLLMQNNTLGMLELKELM